jgi:hypothetical protein
MRKFVMMGAVLGLCALVVPASAATAGGARAGGARAGRASVSATTTTPTLTASPSTGLLDGQSISVAGSGLAAKTRDVVAECVTGATDPLDSCDVGSSRPVKSNGSGSFSISFTAVRTIEPGEFGSSVDCATAGACILAVFDEGLSLLADTPITFADVTIVPPTVSAVPSTGLLDGQKIKVTGANWSPGAHIALAECPAQIDEGCGFSASTGHGITAGTAGTFSASFKVSRFIDQENGPLDCAQPSTCVLEAFNIDDPDQTASTPITFADVVIVPPVMTASPSADLVDGQDITVTGTGFRHHDYIALSECTARPAESTECAGLNGEGNLVQVETDSRGRFTATFNVARVLTLENGTVDCTVAPGCVIGAVEEQGLIQAPEAVTALSFNPAVPPLPPLNLELAIHPTGLLVARAKGQTEAEITGTISCDRTTPVPVSFELDVSQAGRHLSPGKFVTGVTTCRRGGSTFSETVPTSKRHPAVAGIAGVVMGLSAVSGSSSQDISVSAAVTLKAPKS